MSAFTEFEAFEPVHSGSTLYVLTQPLVWAIGVEGSDWKLSIDAGTSFDISVPRALSWALSPHDRRVLPAAAIHDELLRLGHDAAFASAEFRRAAIARGVPVWFGWLLFCAVLTWTALLSPDE